MITYSIELNITINTHESSSEKSYQISFFITMGTNTLFPDRLRSLLCSGKDNQEGQCQKTHSSKDCISTHHPINTVILSHGHHAADATGTQSKRLSPASWPGNHTGCQCKTYYANVEGLLQKHIS